MPTAKPRRIRKHRMDLRGLTSDERKVGAIVRTAMGRVYRVTGIANGIAIMEPVKPAAEEEQKK